MGVGSKVKRWVLGLFGYALSDVDPDLSTKLLTATNQKDLILAAATGTPASFDYSPYVARTLAIPEIRRGTATAAGTATKTIIFKNAAGTTLLTLTVGTDITAGADGTAFATNIVAWLNTGSNLATAGLTAVTDNLDGTFDMTGPVDGSVWTVTTTDTHLSFAETQAGAAEVDVTKKMLVGDIALPAWTIKSADFAAAKGHRYQVDTSGGVVIATLPVSAAAGDEIVFEDAALAWATNALTLDRNGLKINSGTSNYTANVVGGRLSCVYISASIGWSVK